MKLIRKVAAEMEKKIKDDAKNSTIRASIVESRTRKALARGNAPLRTAPPTRFSGMPLANPLNGAKPANSKNTWTPGTPPSRPQNISGNPSSKPQNIFGNPLNKPQNISGNPVGGYVTRRMKKRMNRNTMRR